jgi:hypothetical protein
MGLSPAEIVSEHPSITLIDVHAPLASDWRYPVEA